MESNCETVTLTPSKSKSKLLSQSKLPENTNPNVLSPNPKKIEKSETKKSICSPSPKQKIRERKFVVVAKKKKNLKGEKDVNNNNDKTLISAYESLRASQEDFFRVINCNKNDDQVEGSNPNITVLNADDEKEVGVEVSGEKRKSIPEPGSGRVKDLVKAFENKLTLPKMDDDEGGKENEGGEDEAKRDSRWELSSVSFCASDLLLTAENLGLGSRVSSSLDGSNGRNSGIGGRRQNRRNSSESASSLGGGKWKRRMVRATSLQPFKLRTEQRGRSKQEEFMKKVQEMMIEQEKQRIPVAQGVPYTTDEPECLVKPPVKESTRPVDLVLHSDIRAVERAEFDHQVQEKLSFIEQYKLERERQQKLEEEEELKRLRKELVPKAQPMPYFDRPFIPRRSERQPTIPKEPRFHNPQHKKIRCCMSWSDMSAQCQHEQ